MGAVERLDCFMLSSLFSRRQLAITCILFPSLDVADSIGNLKIQPVSFSRLLSHFSLARGDMSINLGGVSWESVLRLDATQNAQHLNRKHHGLLGIVQLVKCPGDDGIVLRNPVEERTR